jgi:Signal transduction histidine kinase
MCENDPDDDELERLRVENARFVLFMDNVPDLCLLLDADFHYLYGNRAAANLPGHKGRLLIGEAIPLRRCGDPERKLEPYRDVLKTGVPITRELTLSCGPGDVRRYSIHAFKAGDGLGLVLSDVTENRRRENRLSTAEAELRSLAQHILDAREEERKSLARELHDELGQDLSAIEMELGCMARDSGGLGVRQEERIGELRSLVRQSLVSVQRICSELRPAILDRLGLKAAMESLAEDVGERYDILPSTRIDIREEAIGPKASIALFRITQEALTNVVRHARARSFELALRDTGRAVDLAISDDGVGISEAEAEAPLSFGIQGIRERARSLGGSVSIRGEPGRGSSLEVELPFPPEGRLP